MPTIMGLDGEGAGGYRHWRLLVSANNGGTLTALAELVLRTAPGGPQAATGGTASASSEYNATFGAAHAFDGSAGEPYWATADGQGAPSWLAYDFGHPVTIVEYAITARPAGDVNGTPRAWTLQASPDGVAWEAVDAQSGQGGWSLGEARAYSTLEGTTDPGWGDALWKMDFETGDTADWVTPYPGHEAQDPGSFQNSGNASIAFTTTTKRRGAYAAALTCDFGEPGEHGARMFRGRFESEDNPAGLYYSAWFYVPRHYTTPADWWNIWQWKSKGAGESNPMWVLDLLDQGDGTMALRLRDKTSGTSTLYPQNPVVAFPLGEWVHVEGFYRPSNTGTGAVTIWQNDELLWHFTNVNTVEPGALDCRWSTNNYGEGVGGGVVTIHVDDVAISTLPLGRPQVPEGAVDPGWGDALWGTDFEDGTLAAFDSTASDGTGAITVGGARTRRGAYAAALSADFTQAGSQGCFLNRGRSESAANPAGLYYSAWFYLPAPVATPAGSLTIWQYQSKGAADASAQSTWSLELLNEGGVMVLRARDKTSATTDHEQAAPVAFPVGEWVHVEAFVKPGDAGDGAFRVWQNDVKLLDFAAVTTTRDGTLDNRWSIRAYGSGVGSGTTTLYVDDVAISTSPLGAPA